MAIFRLGKSPVGVRQLVYNAPANQAWLDGCPWSALETISSYGADGYIYYANDFLLWEGPTADAAAPGTGGWVVTSVDGLAGTAESVDVLPSQQNGILRILTNAADDDNTSVVQNGEPFRYVVGKEMWFGIRCAPQTAADGELFFGLGVTALDPINTQPTDGLFFEKAETATAMDFHARASSVATEATSLDTTAMADDTFHTYGFHVKKSGAIDVVYDDVIVTSVAAGNANLPTTEDLAIHLQVQTGSAATRYMDIDWLFCAAER